VHLQGVVRMVKELRFSGVGWVGLNGIFEALRSRFIHSIYNN